MLLAGIITPCSPVKFPALQMVKKALNLFVHAPDGLHFTHLVDRTGDGERLAIFGMSYGSYLAVLALAERMASSSALEALSPSTPA